MPDARFIEFPTSSKQAWLDKVKKDLKGKALASLNWQISEDWTVSPFAHRTDLVGEQSPIVQAGRTNNTWEIGEQLSVTSVKEANQIALTALANGVNALLFELPSKLSVENFEELLKDVELAWISIHFKTDITDNLSAFSQYIDASKYEWNELKGSWRMSMRGLDISIQNTSPAFKFIHVDGIPFYQDTASTIAELTQILRFINEYVRQIEADHIQQIHVSIAIGESYFIDIAKIRALKLLWQNLLSAYGLDTDTPLSIEAQLAPTSRTEDQYQNMIKAATQALSAVVGGVDRLFIAPADGQENRFTKRIARNVQHLLQLESHLDHVIDPAAGSYYVEQLTQEIGERVWNSFRSIH